jgi:hypothetical protein
MIEFKWQSRLESSNESEDGKADKSLITLPRAEKRLGLAAKTAENLEFDPFQEKNCKDF